MQRITLVTLLIALLLPLGSCARQAEVTTDPAAGMATLVVMNHTTWTIDIEAETASGTAETLSIGRVEPGATATFLNVPTRQPVVLRAAVAVSPRILVGPTRTFQPNERWEWMIMPGDNWRTP